MLGAEAGAVAFDRLLRLPQKLKKKQTYGKSTQFCYKSTHVTTKNVKNNIFFVTIIFCYDIESKVFIHLRLCRLNGLIPTKISSKKRNKNLFLEFLEGAGAELELLFLVGAGAGAGAFQIWEFFHHWYKRNTHCASAHRSPIRGFQPVD